MQHHIEIDGIPLVIKEDARGRALLGDLDADSAGSNDMFNLRAAVSLVVPSLALSDEDWNRIRIGHGVGNPALSVAPVNDQDRPEAKKAIAAFVEKIGTQPKGPIWRIRSNVDFTEFYIPYGTLMKIFTLARDIDMGNEVVFPEGTVDRGIREDDPEDAQAPKREVSSAIAKDLDQRIGELLAAHALAQPDDLDALATLGAKRRFLHADLDSSGLLDLSGDPPAIPDLEQMPHLARYIAAIHRLRDYLRSSERARWSSLGNHSKMREAPVSLEWFLHNQPPPGIDDFDWLSRCEAIYTEQNEGNAAVFYTRIHGHRVKLVSHYEDGTRLKLVSALAI